MLNYSKKNLNIITFCITLTVCILLFILLDVCFLKAAEAKNNENIYLNYQEYSSVKRKNQNKDAIDLPDTYLELMQIADIYDENTKIEEIENEGVVEEKETEDANLINQTNIKTNWRIEIPKINVNAPIKAGTTQDVLAVAVGHFNESNKWNGNVALAGHNRGYNCNFFQNIKNLEMGDKIIYHTDQGTREYEVVVNKIIKQTDWSYIEDTEDNRITLITCVENMYEYRRCIQAVEIS